MTSSRGHNPERPPPAAGFARGAWFLLSLHLVLSPLVFSTATADVFEETKAALLTLTALALAALALMAAIGKRDVRPVVIGVLGAGLRRDLVLLGFFLCALSAAISTVTSVSPLTSWRGAT